VLNGETYDTSSFTGATSFDLTVSASPCYSAVATASTPVEINVVVFAAITTYGGFSSFSYSSSLGASACGSFTYTAAITPFSSVTPATFEIQPTTMNF
jgi:hypothetical protein